FPLSMGRGRKVTFWLPMILSIDDKAHAIFIEPRRARGLTAEGRRFAFSMMHERIRAADEDFADVRLAIVRFADPDGDRRSAKLFTDAGVDLYSLDELELMVASTYHMWSEVLEERESDTRRRSTGTGPLI
ncbi:MAG: type VI toxin-antitoxin system SocB family DNA replication inhibitor toxin, partial [Rhodobacterales bacterium]